MDLESLTPATRQFINEVSECISDLEQIPGGRVREAAEKLVDHITARNVYMLSEVPGDQVTLTDEQWTELADHVRRLSSAYTDGLSDEQPGRHRRTSTVSIDED
jgi:hypothetical protein